MTVYSYTEIFMNFVAIRDKSFGNNNRANELNQQDFINLPENAALFLMDKCNFKEQAFLNGLRKGNCMLSFDFQPFVFFFNFQLYLLYGFILHQI